MCPCDRVGRCARHIAWLIPASMTNNGNGNGNLRMGFEMELNDVESELIVVNVVAYVPVLWNCEG